MGLLSSRFDFNDEKAAKQNGLIRNSQATDTTNGIDATVSAQSFEQRRHIEKNRQYVAGYGGAKLMHGYRQDAQKEAGQGGAKITYREPGAAVAPRPGPKPKLAPRVFREPQTRKYNPYG